MKIAILGTGNVGQTFATKFIELGHDVMMGTRNVTTTKERKATDNYGSLPFGEWQSNNTKVQLGTFAESVSFGEIIINALQGAITISTIESIDKASFENKIMIDISNPLDFSKGFPPTLLEGLNNSNSLGEEIQKSIPNAKVVKTLNTMYSGIMVNPAMINGGNHTNFICGNDEAAKETVKGMLKDFGWKSENIIDLGDIANSRGTEATLLIWTRIYGATQNGAFNTYIVK
jgi:8-hydroxy-5-deazaflavin:NADPH oxidoreductase